MASWMYGVCARGYSSRERPGHCRGWRQRRYRLRIRRVGPTMAAWFPGWVRQTHGMSDVSGAAAETAEDVQWFVMLERDQGPPRRGHGVRLPSRPELTSRKYCVASSCAWRLVPSRPVQVWAAMTSSAGAEFGAIAREAHELRDTSHAFGKIAKLGPRNSNSYGSSQVVSHTWSEVGTRPYLVAAGDLVEYFAEPAAPRVAAMGQAVAIGE